MNKSLNIMFSMIMSVIFSISSNSWFMVWMGMEINMSFLPLIMEQKNMSSKESALTYFLVQTIASMLLMMSVIMMMMINNPKMNLYNESMSEM